MIGSVDFTGLEEMYEELEKTSNIELTQYFTIFDTENKTIWICWCDEGMVR